MPSPSVLGGGSELAVEQKEASRLSPRARELVIMYFSAGIAELGVFQPWLYTFQGQYAPRRAAISPFVVDIAGAELIEPRDRGRSSLCLSSPAGSGARSGVDAPRQTLSEYAFSDIPS
jgi:hypothetical protein